MKTKTNKRGAVLLIAILMSSVALAVGIGVYNRTYKELLFASFWEQTQKAFAAADSGLECALYYELHSTEPMKCFGAVVPLSTWNPKGLTGASGFYLDIYGSSCVNIRVFLNGSATTTEARGFNATCANVTAGTNPRIVERGLRVSI